VRARACLAALGLLAAATAGRADEESREPLPTYAVDFTAQIVPTQRSARASIRLGAGSGPVEWLRFRIDPERHRDFEADGELVSTDDGLEWRPPAGGGELSYEFTIDHLRDERSYDARCASEWAIFRGGDLFPPARVRTKPPARSRSRLYLQLPEGWSAAVPYPRTPSGFYSVQHPRRFDRPTGWFALGRLGVVREEVAGTRVAIAGPAGHDQRRMDILAFLRWTLPSLGQLFGELPERLQIVGAGDPMWRGGLSGPGSLFLHTERPLISLDGTSPLLHELMHTLVRRTPGPGGDWISEGLAELYSVEILHRSTTTSADRHAAIIAKIEERALEGGKLRVREVSGATTAKAVSTLLALDRELAAATDGLVGLDDLLRRLMADPRSLTTSRLRAHAEELAGRDLSAFFDPRFPPIDGSH